MTTAEIHTKKGVMKINFFEEDAPNTVKNFITLAEKGFYDGLTFHRVIPDFMKAKELAFDEADEMHTVVTMRERKLMMESRADAFLALPGGWGTLEEIMEILTLRQLDVVKKPCVFYNQDGFYDDLIRLFEKMLAEKFFKPSNMDLFRVASSVPDIFTQIEAARGVQAESKWFQTK